MIRLVLFYFGICFLSLLADAKEKGPVDLTQQLPPNGIRISENYYIDVRELSNMDWLEYQFWTKKVYGEFSEEYYATEPDQYAWAAIDPGLQPYAQNYLDHPAYCNYPVVCISQAQAQAYCKWRSDRLMEYVLISYGVFPYEPVQLPETHFTIERYFKGEYKGIQPSERFKQYPEFALPDTSELDRIMFFRDSVNYANEKKSNSAKCAECRAKYRDINAGVKLAEVASYEDLVQPVDLHCGGYKKHYVFHLIGNVAEWTNVPNLSFGGGWLDQLKTLGKHYIAEVSEANAYTGFRCVCRWKDWKQ